MASSSKKKTTFAKLTRENKVRERRQLKEQRKEARKAEAQRLAAEPAPAPEAADSDDLQSRL